MTKFEEEINKTAKIIYENSKEYGRNLNDKVLKIITLPYIKKWEIDLDVTEKITEIFYYFREIIYPKYKNNIDTHTLRNVLFMLLYALEERIFFEATIYGVKNYSHAKLYKKIKEFEDFIEGSIKIPSNPNHVYLDTLRIIKEITPIKEEDIIELLNIVYDKKRRAKTPKIYIEDLLAERELYEQIFNSSPIPPIIKEYLEKIEKLIHTYK